MQYLWSRNQASYTQRRHTTLNLLGLDHQEKHDPNEHYRRSRAPEIQFKGSVISERHSLNITNLGPPHSKFGISLSCDLVIFLCISDTINKAGPPWSRVKLFLAWKKGTATADTIVQSWKKKGLSWISSLSLSWSLWSWYPLACSSAHPFLCCRCICPSMHAQSRHLEPPC